MKKRSLNSRGPELIPDRGASLVLLALAQSLLQFSVPANASMDLDRQYALETVGFLRSSDNVDGLFSDYVLSAYREYFADKSRFVVQDLSKADSVLISSKIPYAKVIDDAEVLAQLARTTRSQTLIRTKIRKEGGNYRFTQEWLHSPKMDLLAVNSFVLAEPGSGRAMGLGDVKSELQKGLSALLSRVPFQATLTGRDGESVTVNVGANSGIRPGDALAVSTLDEIKTHPITREIVQWRLTPVGKVEIDQVEDAIAFGRVIEEEQGRQLARYQKVVQVFPAARADKPVVIDEVREEREKLAQELPKVGWISGGPWLGNFSRELTSASRTGQSGAGTVFGARADGQVWLNREWFTEIGLSFGYWSYSQKSLPAGTANLSGVTGTVLQTKLGLGYSYSITENFFGPKGWIKGGFRSTAYSLPINATYLTAPISFKTLVLGVGGDLPLRGGYGALLALDFGLFPGATQTGLASTGAPTSATDVSFFIGGYFRPSPRMTLRAGVDVSSQGAGFRASELSQKTVSFAPSLLYYF